MRTGLAIGLPAVCEPGEEEVGGVLERGGIAGAFGAKRQGACGTGDAAAAAGSRAGHSGPCGPGRIGLAQARESRVAPLPRRTPGAAWRDSHHIHIDNPNINTHISQTFA